MGQLRSDIGVWVVGAVALIALVVFGGLWLTRTSLVSRLDGISRETRRQNEQLQARVAALQGQVKKLEERLAGHAESADEAAASGSAESVDEAGASDPAPDARPAARPKGRVYVRITSRPANARVRRGNRTLGRTPLVLPMGRDETATLVIQLAGHVGQRVTVDAGEGRSVRVRLKKKRAGSTPVDPQE